MIIQLYGYINLSDSLSSFNLEMGDFGRIILKNNQSFQIVENSSESSLALSEIFRRFWGNEI